MIIYMDVSREIRIYRFTSLNPLPGLLAPPINFFFLLRECLMVDTFFDDDIMDAAVGFQIWHRVNNVRSYVMGNIF